MPLTTTQERKIEQTMLTAEKDSRYWGCLTRRYQAFEQNIKIFLAVIAVPSLGAWVGQTPFKPAFQLLSVLSAVVAVVHPILKLQTKIAATLKLHTEYNKLAAAYENIWQSLDHLTEAQSVQVWKDFQKLQEKEEGFTALVATLPLYKGLVEQCFNEVCRSRGLQSPLEKPKSTEQKMIGGT